MGRIKTYTAYSGTGAVPESAKLYNTELNAMQDEYEAAFQAWRPLEHEQIGYQDSATGRSLTSFPGGTGGTTNTVAGLAGVGAAAVVLGAGADASSGLGPFPTEQGPFRLDPADYAAGARVARMRLRAHLIAGNSASNQTFNVGLFPAPSVTGSAQPTVSKGLTSAQFAGLVAGSTATIASGVPANSVGRAVSTDFAMPSAGWYVVAAWWSGALASPCTPRVEVQYRQT